MNFGRVITADCVNIPPPPDARCSDPAFALAHPEICPVEPTLIIKPGVALACAMGGSVQFRAVYVTNGIEEDVTSDCIFTSSDPNVAVVGAVTGLATGLSGGEATITATYDGKQIHADFTVIESAQRNCCEEITTAVCVLIDVTRSMSLPFSTAYKTRLHFAKAAAKSFMNGMNEAKDVVGLMTFVKDTPTIIQVPTTENEACAALVDSISQTDSLTDFYEALAAGVAQLDSVTADRKVLLIISDGEDLSQTYLQGGNPLEIVSAFKEAGGIVMCLGTRSYGRGYNLLSAFATGGMFINATKLTGATSIAYLNGLRGYVCGGNCVPDGDVWEATPQLDFSAFSFWNVIDGHVDLLGNGLMDYIPNEGLYVNLRSIAQDPDDTSLGMLETNQAIALTEGTNYTLRVDLAGNQLVSGTYVVAIRVLYRNVDGTDGTVVLNRNITMSDYTKKFKTYNYTFNAPHSGDAFIRIGMESIPSSKIPKTGCLLNQVRFKNEDIGQVLFQDDFNTDNLTYIPPRCGQGQVFLTGTGYGYGYSYGYDCYGEGCLSDPPPEQRPELDNADIPDIESGYVPPKTYTSTRQATAYCDAGSGSLGSSLVPPMTSNTAPQGQAIGKPNPEGYATAEPYYAFSKRTDIWRSWNGHLMDADPVPYTWLGYDAGSGNLFQVGAYGIRTNTVFYPMSWEFQGSLDGETWITLSTVENETGWLDDAERLFNVEAPGTYRFHRIYITRGAQSSYTPNGSVMIRELSFYGATSASITATATATSTISQADADAKAYAAALEAATAQLNCVEQFTATVEKTAVCPWYLLGEPKTASATATSYISQTDAENKAAAEAIAAAEALLVCGETSNNTQAIIIPTSGDGRANPYPSIQMVEFAGVPTSIKCKLYGVKHDWVSDLSIVLRAPNGQYVVLMWNNVGSYALGTNTSYPIGGGFFLNSKADWTFDDAGATPLPVPPTNDPVYRSSWHSGIYKPSGLNGLISPAPWTLVPVDPEGYKVAHLLPCPICAPEKYMWEYKSTFAALIATMAAGDANGAWCLIVWDRKAEYGGSIDHWEVILA